VLDRRLAQTRHYPAIDVLRSVSRLTSRLQDEEHKVLSSRFIQTLSHFKQSEDMIRIGAYVKGSHPDTDYAIDMIERLNEYLIQPVEEYCSVEQARSRLQELGLAR